MKRYFSIIHLATLLALLLSGCSKYQTQYEGPYEDPTDADPNAGKVTYEIVYVQSGKLYMTNKALTKTKQLPTTGQVAQASINFAHNKIAYKTASGNIAVIDSAGTFIADVPASSSVKWFDWYSDEETLYMVTADNKLKFYGPGVSGVGTNLESGLPWLSFSTDIYAVAIRPDKTVLTAYSIYDGLNYQKGVWVNYPAGAGTDFSINTQYEDPVRLRINKAGTSGVVTGYNSFYSTYGISIDPSYFLSEVGNDLKIVAVSPDGADKVYWAYDGLYLQNYPNNLSVGAAEVVDIDW